MFFFEKNANMSNQEDLPAQVKHEFLCEWIGFKQRHLLDLVSDQECCLFGDATKVFTDDRHCLRHDACCVS